jgi:hypothetical protein
MAIMDCFVAPLLAMTKEDVFILLYPAPFMLYYLKG